MKILMVSPTLGDAYGQERVMRDSTALLRQAGHEVYFLADEKTGDIPPCDGYRLIPGLRKIGTLTHPRRAARLEALAVQYALETEPDVVHFIEQFDFRLMQRLSDLFPSLLTAHTVAPTCPASHRRIEGAGACPKKSGWTCLLNNVEYGCLNGFKSIVHRAHAVQEFYLKRQVSRRFPVIGAISHYLESILIRDGWEPEKVRLITNPVDVERESLPTPTVPKNLILSASRLVPLKGIDRVIRALEALSTLDWEFWICGEGPERKSLESLAAQLGLSHRIRFLGQKNFVEVRALMAQSRMVVQANTGPEGFGLSIAESAALGVPTIVTDVPAFNEIVINEETGLTVPLGNCAALSHAITRLLMDQALWEKLASQAPGHIRDHHSGAIHLAQTLAAYRACQNHFESSSTLLEIEWASSLT